jgi:hypothetical protein
MCCILASALLQETHKVLTAIFLCRPLNVGTVGTTLVPASQQASLGTGSHVPTAAVGTILTGNIASLS